MTDSTPPLPPASPPPPAPASPPPPAPRSTGSASPNRTTAAILAFFLGWFGAHKFYLGRPGIGAIFLLVNTVGLFFTWILAFLPNIATGVIALVEFIIFLTKSDEEFHRIYVVEKKAFF